MSTATTAARVIRNGTARRLYRRLQSLPSGRLLKLARRSADLVPHTAGDTQARLVRVVSLALRQLASRTPGYVAL